MEELIQTGTPNQVDKFFASLEDHILLKLHKYFFWANKKLHSVFFIEDKDQISEDLLIEFKSEDEQENYQKSKGQIRGQNI